MICDIVWIKNSLDKKNIINNWNVQHIIQLLAFLFELCAFFSSEIGIRKTNKHAFELFWVCLGERAFRAIGSLWFLWKYIYINDNTLTKTFSLIYYNDNTLTFTIYIFFQDA